MTALYSNNNNNNNINDSNINDNDNANKSLFLQMTTLEDLFESNFQLNHDMTIIFNYEKVATIDNSECDIMLRQSNINENNQKMCKFGDWIARATFVNYKTNETMAAMGGYIQIQIGKKTQTRKYTWKHSLLACIKNDNNIDKDTFESIYKHLYYVLTKMKNDLKSGNNTISHIQAINPNLYHLFFLFWEVCLYICIFFIL